MIIRFLSSITAFHSFWRSVARSNLGISLIPIVLLVLIGTLGYAWFEGWSLVDALYATVITITTVGYGDFSPQTIGGRIFAVFFALSAIGLAGYAISTLAAVVIEYETTREHRKIQERQMKRITTLENHTIVCGANVLAHRVSNEFIRRDEPFIIIEQDQETLRWALLWMHKGYVDKRRRHIQHLADVNFSPEEQKSVAELADEMNVAYLLDDPTDEQQLRQAGIERARGLVAALNDDRDNLAVVLSARDMGNRLGNPNLRIIARVFNEWNMRRLYLAGADKVTSPNFVGGFQMATHMLNPTVGDFWDRMLFQNDDLMRFIDIDLADRPEWVGKTVAALHREELHLVGAIRRADDYLYAPHPDTVFAPGDILIVMSPPDRSNVG